jgi:eukaryotic-like serine/threonine-protein kinase
LTIVSGTRLGRYEIRSKIGAGGMGEVYLAQDTSELGRLVALKILPAEVAKDKDRLQRFTQEARTVSNLNHPNILTVHEFGQTDTALFIATEYVEGVTLREHLSRRRLKLIDILDVAIQIVAALNAAHEAGVTHRDLKPENVMVRKDHIVKVLDFGLAKLSEPPAAAGGFTRPEPGEDVATMVMVKTEPGLVMGTVNYMSPEQSVGTGVDQRTDIWSAGVVLYEMISGSIPFPGKDIHRQIIAIQEAEPVPLAQQVEGLPERLEEIVTKCLAKDKNERYQTAKDLLIDLRNLRRKLDVDAEIDRTVSPALRSPSARATISAAPPTSSANSLVSGIQQHKIATLTILVLVVLAGAALMYAFRRFSFASKPAPAHFQSMSISRVTTEGNVDSVTLSPDGKYIAYSLEENGKRSLWTKHLGTGSRVQIVPPVESLAMNASTFSPDGGYIYYTRVDEQNPKGALYQVPVLGGVTPKKIITDVSQPVTISPDGKQIAFGRFHLTSPEDELFVANVDGSNERTLIKVSEPDWLSGANAAWSPDGKMLAVGYGSKVRDPGAPDGTYAMSIGIVSIANPSLKPLTSQSWPYTGNVAWFSDGTGVTFVAREQRLKSLQIWQAAYPGGETHRLTNDLNSYDYYSLSLTADGRALVAVQTDPVSNIWVAPDGDANRARAITSGRNVQEGHYGVMWTPDNKLVFDSDVKSKASIWIVNRDGSESKPLTDGSADDFMPEVSRDGRYVVFASSRKGFQLWRMDIDGSNPIQLTHETGAPTCSISPDGRWVVYSLYLGGIFKVSIDGGSPTVVMARGNLRYPQLSPDGKLLAYSFDDEQTKRPKLGVIDFESGTHVRTFDLPVTAGSSFYESAFHHGFHWSPDGRALIYINTLSGVSNLWRQPTDGSPPKQITNFKSDLIYNFAYSRDGKDLALSRGIHTRDAVLISEAK